MVFHSLNSHQTSENKEINMENDEKLYKQKLEQMQNTTSFQRKFGEHKLYQNSHWLQYSFHDTLYSPKHWPLDLWNECWCTGYVDFTTDNWVSLTWEEQFQYAKSYQEWYMHYSCLYNKIYSGMELILVPPGKFWMGSPEDETGREDGEIRHRVLISKPFFIGKYPVTQKQWTCTMGENYSEFKKENLPVDYVSWEKSRDFCRKLGGSLPTEAQWEYACRAGTTTPFNLGDSINDEKVNCEDCLGQTSPVGNYPYPNSWGCYDMHGNIWEWCNDYYGDYSAEDAVDPTGPDSGRLYIMRSGYWFLGDLHMRSAFRCKYTSEINYAGFYGFRFVQVIE